MSYSTRSSGLRSAFIAAMALSLLQVVPVMAQEPVPVVTEAEGLAFNYYTDVSLFGGPFMRRGYNQEAEAVARGQEPPPATAASPSVECPVGGGTDSVTDPDGARAVYGPAVIFGGIWPDDHASAPPSGPLTSSIDCQLGQDGHVTSSTSLTLMPPEAAYPGGAGPGPLIADEVHSSCTMAADGTVTSDVTFVNGIVETSYDPETQLPVESEEIPDNPEPGYTVEGTIDHVGDEFRITFNVQTQDPDDGSFTVVAAHMELLGPIAVGDMIVGSSTCGPMTTEVAEPPATGLSLTGPATAPVGESATVTATVTDEDAPVAGVEVDFSVVPADSAVPETGTATTGVDGQASFSFTGTAAVSYTVTASAMHDEQALSDTHIVTFTEPVEPEPGLSLTGPASAVVGESVTVTATVSDNGTPIPGVDVGFSVVPADSASPETGTATTGLDGQASFTFTATTPQTHTVTASATHEGQPLSDTHTVAFTEDAEPPPPAPAGPCVDLRVNDRLAVGEVCVTNTVDNLLVTYTTTGGWRLRATNLHVAHEVDDIPRGWRGHPRLWRFDHRQRLTRPPVTTFTHSIPLDSLNAASGDELVVAAQADVQRRADRRPTRAVSAWGDGAPLDNGDAQASSHRSREDRGTFFTYTVQSTAGMTCVDLKAGRRLVAGEVCVSNAAGDLTVRYLSVGAWQLRTTRLHVADDVGGVPASWRGHPMSRQFDHWAPHRPPVTSAAHTIPLGDVGATAGSELVVAAQADVQQPNSWGWMRTASAWGDGERFTRSHPGTYFVYTVQ